MFVRPPSAEIRLSGRYGEVDYTGVAHVFLGEDGVLDLPVLVPDGFDPDSSRDWPCIYESMSASNTLNLLLARGFDMIVVDFDDGAADIRGNAAVFEAALREIARRMMGPPVIGVVGPSMGGQIARYALLRMEGNDQAHHVDLLALYDSPNLGANIPASAQYFLHTLQAEAGEAREGWQAVNTVAARQLLLTHVTTGALFPVGREEERRIVNDLGPHPLHLELQRAFADMGDYPDDPRIVAFANGSARGQPIQRRDGAPLRPRDGLLFTRAQELGGLVARVRVDMRATTDMRGDEIFFYDQNVRETVETLIVGSVLTGINPFAGSAYASFQLFSGNAGTRLIDGKDFRVAYIVSGSGLDGVPGGTTDVIPALARALRQIDQVDWDEFEQRVDATTFIPTKSALGYTGGFYDDILSEVASGRQSTPFDAIYDSMSIAGRNESHVCINPAQRDVLIFELDAMKGRRDALRAASWLYPILLR